MMLIAAVTSAPLLAAGWSILYLILGASVGGAIQIFFGLKMVGR